MGRLSRRLWSHQAAAFTTAELLIVLVIVGVLAAVATPPLHRWLSIIGVDTAARELAATLQLGKMRAIAENRRYRMSFDLAQHAYVVQKEVFGVWHNVEDSKALRAGLQLVSVSEGRNPLYFEPLGTMPSGNATIILQNAQGRSRTVAISTAGRVRVK